MKEMPTLRFITCGSVDDGKSTLIGRLLHDSKNVFADQLSALEVDSERYGTQGTAMDLALLVDGLQAEREQSITIDVAYRFFSTDKRRYIVADTPGHEQYTRNMATGASTADLAIILVDARKGILTQTRRHARIVSLMGIKHVVLAVNKMDLLGFAEPIFNDIVRAFQEASVALGFSSNQAIPVSALAGDNVFYKSIRMSWYSGPTLLDYLDGAVPTESLHSLPFRMAVQGVNRPHPEFRGFMGRIAQGTIRRGDLVQVLPSGQESRVKSIVVWQGELDQAQVGDSITITLERDVDVSRGDLLSDTEASPECADQFKAHLLWMSDQALVAGRSYLVKLHTKELPGTITAIRSREDLNTGLKLAASSLEMNEIGIVNLGLTQRVPFEPYASNRNLGGFILIDRLSLETVGVGMIDFSLRRAANLHWQTLGIDKRVRAEIKQQRPRCIWFTGLSGSGKSTIASLLEQRLHGEGRHTILLDGDNIRHGLNRDLGFTLADRAENIRRIAEVAKLMTDAGLIVLVSFISPFRSERQLARGLFEEGEFIEVFVDTPLMECERRDVKGLYAKARRGDLPNFTGIDSAYEAPINPEVHLLSGVDSPEACVDQVLTWIN